MEKKFEDYTHVIVTVDGMPAAMDDEQFCVCTNEECQDEAYPVRIYTVKRAKELIKKSTKFRHSKGWYDTDYHMIPVANNLKP